MNPRWIIFAIFLFLGMSLLAISITGSYLPDNVANTIETLISKPDLPISNFPVIGPIVTYITMGWNYLQLLWTLFWMDFPFFAGAWGLARLFFLGVAVAIVISFLLAIRGTSSG